MKLLKEAREAKGLTQTELAELVEANGLKLKQNQISALELGKRFPRPATRKGIEDVLGVEIDWVTTRMQGPISLGYAENESPEDGMLRSLFVYFKSAQRSEVQGRIKFVKQVVKRFEKELKKPRR